MDGAGGGAPAETGGATRRDRRRRGAAMASAVGGGDGAARRSGSRGAAAAYGPGGPVPGRAGFGGARRRSRGRDTWQRAIGRGAAADVSGG